MRPDRWLGRMDVLLVWHTAPLDRSSRAANLDAKALTSFVHNCCELFCGWKLSIAIIFFPLWAVYACALDAGRKGEAKRSTGHL